MTAGVWHRRWPATGHGGAPIYPASETEFFVKAIPVELTFQLDKSGTPTDVTVRFHGSEMHGRRRR